jgi:hypothetical protein
MIKSQEMAARCFDVRWRDARAGARKSSARTITTACTDCGFWTNAIRPPLMPRLGLTSARTSRLEHSRRWPTCLQGQPPDIRTQAGTSNLTHSKSKKEPLLALSTRAASLTPSPRWQSSAAASSRGSMRQERTLSLNAPVAFQTSQWPGLESFKVAMSTLRIC